MFKPTPAATLVALTLSLASLPVLAVADPGVHPPATPGTGPSPSALRLQPSRFPATRSGATHISFKLDGPGWIVQTVERDCGAPSCPRIGPAVTRIGRLGVNHGRFIGRVAGRPLRRGRYRLMFRGGGATTSAPFRIVRP